MKLLFTQITTEQPAVPWWAVGKRRFICSHNNETLKHWNNATAISPEAFC